MPIIFQHLKTSLPRNFDAHQFAYKANQSAKDAIATTLHMALNHQELPWTYVKMLFANFSLAFNTIIPDILVEKLDSIPFMCSWIKSFLSNHPQVVKVVSIIPPL